MIKAKGSLLNRLKTQVHIQVHLLAQVRLYILKCVDYANSVVLTMQTCDDLTSYACRERSHAKLGIHWIRPY